MCLSQVFCVLCALQNNCSVVLSLCCLPFSQKPVSSPALPVGRACRQERGGCNTPRRTGTGWYCCAHPKDACLGSLATKPEYLKFTGESYKCLTTKAGAEYHCSRLANKLRQKVLVRSQNWSFSSDEESRCKSLGFRSFSISPPSHTWF